MFEHIQILLGYRYFGVKLDFLKDGKNLVKGYFISICLTNHSCFFNQILERIEGKSKWDIGFELCFCCLVMQKRNIQKLFLF